MKTKTIVQELPDLEEDILVNKEGDITIIDHVSHNKNTSIINVQWKSN